MKGHKQPTLTLFCGLPGSGKTTLAKKLEAEGRGVRICTDDWQESLGVSHSDEEFHERLQARLYEFALELLCSGQNVILEDGLWQKIERSQKLADAKKCGALTEMHVFDLTIEEIWKRIQQRNSESTHGAVPITKEQLEVYWKIFQPPDDAELARFSHVFVHRA